MKASRLWLACSTALVAVLTSSSGRPDMPAAAAFPPPRSVLFLGNSFTRTQGGLDTHVQLLAASLREPRAVAVQKVTKAGATLAALRADAAVLQAVRAGGYDVVVLQDDLPEYPGPGTDLFKSEVRAFNREILAKGGRTVLFMAWAYERRNWISQADIAAVHRSASSRLLLAVAPVGLAFDAVRAERPGLALLDDDGEHQSPQGMYLAACVVYATLFRESPEGAAYQLEGVTSEEAVLLQRVAWRSVSAWNAAMPG